MKKTLYFLIFIIFLLLNLSTCEEIFTASPFSGLDRDPSDFDLDRKMEYARQALASGDLTYIEKAFDALNAENSTDGEVCLLTATCANELSGMPEIFAAMYDSTSDYYLGDMDYNNPDDIAALNEFANSLNKTYLTEASYYYKLADTVGANMNAIDYFFAGLCVFFNVSTDAGGVEQLFIINGPTAAETAEVDRTDTLLASCSAGLSEGDIKDGVDYFRNSFIENPPFNI